MNRKLLLWQLFMLSGVLVTKSNPTVEMDCTLEETRITCDQTLPEQIPPGVTEVYVMNYNDANIAVHNHVFDHSSWWKVKTLDIIVNLRWDWYIIYESDFVQLKNLTFLGIHTPQLREIRGLAGLDQLIHLDLANCLRLKCKYFIPALMKKWALPNLKSLNLKGVHSVRGRAFVFSLDFMTMLKTKCIERLSLSGTNILIPDIRLFNDTSSLQYIDVTNITFSYLEVLINRLSSAEYLNIFFHNIRTLKIGFTDRFIARILVQKDKFYIQKCHKFPVNVENVYLINVFAGAEYDNVVIDLSNCYKNLKIFHFRENHLKLLNATVIWPREIELIEADFSCNGMKFLSPNVLDQLFSIRNLFLSNNSLFKMEKYKEFGLLLQTFNHLEHFAIAFNALTFIPEQMFANNTQLQVLDIKGNRMETITFKISHLIMLQVLDLRENKILYIDAYALGELIFISQTHTENGSRYLDVDFRGNPLECSCESLDFITWLEHRSEPSLEYICTLDGDIADLDTTSLEKTIYLCHRAAVISIISSLSVVALAAMFVMSCTCAMAIRKRIKRHEIKTFLRAFQNGHVKEKYLVFISHSSVDGDLVVDSVHKIVNTLLKELTGIQNRVVSLGELDFRPGLSIIGEMMKCISESCVVIFVVSQAFCTSNWCRMEVREAFEREKPIILIFKEAVEMQHLPEYLQSVFQRYARSKLVQKNGQYELMPGWHSLCESIVLLASRKEEQPRDDMEQPLLLDTPL